MSSITQFSDPVAIWYRNFFIKNGIFFAIHPWLKLHKFLIRFEIFYGITQTAFFILSYYLLVSTRQNKII